MLYNINREMKYVYHANIRRTDLTQIYPQMENSRSNFDWILVLSKLCDSRLETT